MVSSLGKRPPNRVSAHPPRFSLGGLSAMGTYVYIGYYSICTIIIVLLEVKLYRAKEYGRSF